MSGLYVGLISGAYMSGLYGGLTCRPFISGSCVGLICRAYIGLIRGLICRAYSRAGVEGEGGGAHVETAPQ
eukprot:242986-Rhodomonas_salina.1